MTTPLDISGMLTAFDEQAKSPKTAVIDFSEAIGRPQGTGVLTFRELDSKRFFQVNNDAQAIRRKDPEVPFELAVNIAMLAISHVSPPIPGPPADFYIAMANKSTAAFLYIVARHRAEFTSLNEILNGTEEAKAARGEGSTGSEA